MRPVNDAPTATQNVYAVDESGVLAIGAPGVLANDGDVDGEVLQALLLTAPEHGTLVLRTDGGFTYTPAADFNGDDLFVYTARDAGGLNTAAVVRLDITAVNDAPRPTDDAYRVSEDDTLVVAAPGLLAKLKLGALEVGVVDLKPRLLLQPVERAGSSPGSRTRGTRRPPPSSGTRRPRRGSTSATSAGWPRATRHPRRG